MRIAILDQHLEFFQENGSIAFEDLFIDEEIKTFSNLILEVYSEKRASSFLDARDLWRERDEIKKTIKGRRLAEIASKLTKTTPLRLGYDQYFPPIDENNIEMYQQFFSNNISIQEMSSIQGIVCGALICLSKTSNEEMSDTFLPIDPGTLLFVKPDQPINFSEIINNPGSSYYIVVFTSSKALFVLNRQDFGAKKLIELGYDYGDRLKDNLNPIIYR